MGIFKKMKYKVAAIRSYVETPGVRISPRDLEDAGLVSSSNTTSSSSSSAFFNESRTESGAWEPRERMLSNMTPLQQVGQ